MNAKGKEMEEAMNAKGKEMEEAMNAMGKEMEEAPMNCRTQRARRKWKRPPWTAEHKWQGNGRGPHERKGQEGYGRGRERKGQRTVNTLPPKGSKADNKNKEEKSTLEGSGWNKSGIHNSTAPQAVQERKCSSYLQTLERWSNQSHIGWTSKFELNLIAADGQMVKSMIATGMTGTNTILPNFNKASVATAFSCWETS